MRAWAAGVLACGLALASTTLAEPQPPPPAPRTAQEHSVATEQKAGPAPATLVPPESLENRLFLSGRPLGRIPARGGHSAADAGLCGGAVGLPRRCARSTVVCNLTTKMTRP